MWFPFFLVVLTAIALSMAQQCRLRDYGNGGHVCVCNSSYCDAVPNPERVDPNTYLIYTSNMAGLRFQKSQGTFTETNEIGKNQIYINDEEKYQEMYGWGGAFTDATGINIDSLSQQAQDNLLKSYFSKDGIEYSLCRVPIGGTDFSNHGYTYDDGQEDVNLTKFKLAPDDFKYKIPFIKKAQSLTSNNLRLFASVWTAPKWIKTNKQYDGFGFISTNMYQTWAEYFIKFLDEYREQDVEFWGLTTQNEPSLALVASNINSVGWTPASMGLFIAKHLGPTIRNSTYADIKIMAIDDQRFFLPWFLNSMFEDKTVRDYVDGVAFHWYWNFVAPASLLTKTHNNFPDKFILATEACQGDKPFQRHVDLGSWLRGEAYADDIIQDVQNWVTGWVDWNMALNLEGGPTYIKNFVDSPIIVNATAGEFYKQPMFYALGHFSKFIPRGSVRIGSSSYSQYVAVAAFQRPDNATVVVILNKESQVVPVILSGGSRGSAKINLTAKSITTLLYWK